MNKVVVDVEATGPCPGLYSMISFGAVSLANPEKTFYSEIMKPLPGAQFNHSAMRVTGTTIEDMENGKNIVNVMCAFGSWVQNLGEDRGYFLSDNNGFDWQFINYYFHYAVGDNPFGHSSANVQSLYKGFKKNMRMNAKRLRKTKHTHHPVDDAMGNVEALIAMRKMGLNGL